MRPVKIGRILTPRRMDVYRSCYCEDGGVPAILLTEANVEEIEVKLSVNMVGETLEPNEFFVKTWSENAPFIAGCLESDLFTDTGRRVPAGYGEAHVWRIEAMARTEEDRIKDNEYSEYRADRQQELDRSINAHLDAIEERDILLAKWADLLTDAGLKPETVQAMSLAQLRAVDRIQTAIAESAAEFRTRCKRLEDSLEADYNGFTGDLRDGAGMKGGGYDGTV
jgi:hypothetical protein